MNRFVLVCSLAFAFLLLFSAPQVRADSNDSFTFTESISGIGKQTYTWQLSGTLTPSPVDYATNFGFQVSGVSVSGLSDPVNFLFLNSSQLGGFFAFDAITGNYVFSLNSVLPTGIVQLYSGPAGNQESNPTFLALNIPYVGLDSINGVQACLTISTPEPSAFLMLFAGLVALFGAIALKKAAA